MVKKEKLTLEYLSGQLQAGKIHPSELIEQTMKTISACEKTLNSLNRDTLDYAKAISKNWVLDNSKPYSGIPYLLKDNICTEGIETDCSSNILKGYKPAYSATAEIKLKEQGMFLIGKANLDEFSMGSSTEFSAWGAVKNPFDVSRVPGGSSGGCAAGVGAGYVPFALGSDTGGSVRQPASFCGLVGLRPTYGRVSRWGLVSFASSLDQIGVISNTVRDSAIALQFIEGTDDFDSTAATFEPENYLDSIEKGIEGIRVGILDKSFSDFVDPRVKSVFETNVDWFKRNCSEVKEVSINCFDLLLSAYYILAPSEASSNLARYDGIRFGQSVEIAPPGEYGDSDHADSLLDLYQKNRGRGFGEEVKRRILMGTFALSAGYYDAFYLRACQVRKRLQAELDRIWKSVDIIICPTAPTPPFKLGENLSDPSKMYNSDIFTIFQAMAGCPAISVNGGWTDLDDDLATKLKKSGSKNYEGKPTENLPIGLQLTAAPFAEAVLFRAARAFERDFSPQ